jgi:hypothetical protein
MKKMFVSIIVIALLLTLSTQQCFALQGLYSDEKCYGFVVSLVKNEDANFENQINCKIRHMVNDLLREKTSVYWISNNLNLTIREINGLQDKIMFFEKGSFIIPFTGEGTSDKKINAIVYDYNESSEIDEDSIIKVPVYFLRDTFTTKAYPLSEVKILEVVNKFTSLEHKNVAIAKDCGFLTFDCVEDINLGKKLKNMDYNVAIYPGGSSSSMALNIFTHMLSVNSKPNPPSKVIRDFVANGGGYIGICHGCGVASSGVYPIYLKRKAHNPNLRTFTFLALSDISIALSTFSQIVQLQITNNSHPVTYGLDSIIFSKFITGPKIVRMGKNVQVIALYHETHPALDGKPGWVSSKFGDGRVMLFTSHPECYSSNLETKDYRQRVISNALYFTTNKETIELQVSKSRDLSYIIKIWENTKDLISFAKEKCKLFDEIKISINESLELLSIIPNYYSSSNLISIENFLRDTIKTLSNIEKIYPLLKNDTDFIQSLSILKNDLTKRVNEIIMSFEKSVEKGNQYVKIMGFLLIKLKPLEPLLRVKLIFYNQFFSRFLRQINEGFRLVPRIYFDSLKFLRHHWYNYEANVDIDY